MALSPSGRSRFRPIQRTSVERPIQKSSATCRYVRPLVRARLTAAILNSFVSRFCFVIEALFHKEESHFSESIPLWLLRVTSVCSWTICMRPRGPEIGDLATSSGMSSKK
jgi:hypothetical protein